MSGNITTVPRLFSDYLLQKQNKHEMELFDTHFV